MAEEPAVCVGEVTGGPGLVGSSVMVEEEAAEVARDVMVVEAGAVACDALESVVATTTECMDVDV